MICYVDSSVVLRYLLMHDSVFTRSSQFDVVVSSELLIWKESASEERFLLLSADPHMLTCAAALGVSLIEEILLPTGKHSLASPIWV